MSTQPTITPERRFADHWVAAQERAAKARAAAASKPYPAAAAAMTVDELRSKLFEDWRARGGDCNVDPSTRLVPLALKALDGDDEEGKKGAAVVFALAYLDRYSVEASRALTRSRVIERARVAAREAVALADSMRAAVSSVAAVLAGKGDPEALLAKLATDPATRSYSSASWRGKELMQNVAASAITALSVYHDAAYAQRLGEIEERTGPLPVPRLSAAAEFALGQATALTREHWSPERRADAVDVLRGLLDALAGSYWTVPAKETPTPSKAKAKAKRSSVLEGLLR